MYLILRRLVDPRLELLNPNVSADGAGVLQSLGLVHLEDTPNAKNMIAGQPAWLHYLTQANDT